MIIYESLLFDKGLRVEVRGEASNLNSFDASVDNKDLESRIWQRLNPSLMDPQKRDHRAYSMCLLMHTLNLSGCRCCCCFSCFLCAKHETFHIPFSRAAEKYFCTKLPCFSRSTHFKHTGSDQIAIRRKRREES